MSVSYTKKTWYDGLEGGTPITAAELNRVETGIDDVVTQSNANKANIDTHIAKKVNSSDGAHGLRYYNSELDYYDDTNEEWVEIQTGGGGADVILPNLEYGSVPSKAYSVGDYIYSVRGTLGTDILYVVTAPITRSDTLVVDTNITLSTDEGAEVFVANIISGEYGVPPYNIVGLVNSDGTVTRYGSSKDNSDIANRTLSNIHDTTTTDEFYRYKNEGSLSFDGSIVQSGSKYIASSYLTRNIIHISDDGIHFEDVYADTIPEMISDVFEATINNNTFYVTFGIDRNSGAYGFIYYSTDLEHWTKSNFISGTSSDYQTSGYEVGGYSSINYVKNNKFYWKIRLTYNDELDIAQLISTSNGIDWSVETTNIDEVVGIISGGSIFYDNGTIRLGAHYTTDGTTWYTSDGLANLEETACGGNGAYIEGIYKVGSLYYLSLLGDFGEVYTSEDLEHFTNLTNSNVAFGDLDDTIPAIANKHCDSVLLLSDSIIFTLGGKDENQNPIQGFVVYDIQSNKFNHWEQMPSLSDPLDGYVYEIMRNCDITEVQVPLLHNNDNNNLFLLFKASPFTSEVSKALSILGVGEGGSGGASSAEDVSYDNTDSGLTASNVQDAIDELADGSSSGDYEDLTNLPSVNGVELLGNKAIGTLSGDIQVEYADLLNKPSINGVELLGNKLVGLLSTDIHINADKIGYSGTVSGASTAKSAIDALQSGLSGLHGVPSGGNTNQVLAKNSSSDYDLKWVNQTGGGSGFKIIVTASDYPNKSVTVTESDSGDTVTETTNANGVATFIVSAGTWTATVDDSGTTVTLGSVTVGTTSIEYLGNNVKFAFHYSETDSDPDSVDYPSGYDNSDWGSDTAYMDYTNDTFHYGNWNPSGANADKLSWLFPKPCMLKYDGTVDYYLDPNDYTKKADGTASDIANTSYGGNAMMEWGQNDRKIWWKIIPDVGNNGFTFCVANYQADEDYDCWNHYDCDDVVKDHFYTPIYFGSLVSSKLRSLSGQANSVNTTRQNEIDYATANNTDSKVHWYTEVYSDWLLQGMLTTLITKSLDSQTKIGKGRTDGSNSSAINTGTMNTKGLFWGSTNGTDGVKCWGMENPWGNLWRAIGGLIASTQTVKVKLTPNTHDGTTATSYNIDGTGYTTANTISGSSGYISHMYATKKSLTPATLTGSESTYYCDRCYTTTTANTYYAIVGGYWSTAAVAGALSVNLYNTVSYSHTRNGAALSYK